MCVDVKRIGLDVSQHWSAISLQNKGVFCNSSWLDSELDYTYGSRTFNDQSYSVVNVDFIQYLPDLGASFGATYRKQGDAYGRIVGEEVTTHSGADLEVVVENRWQDVTLRLVGSNLLDASKDETLNKFDTVDGQINRDFDEYDLESEEAGPVIQLMLRYAF